MQSSVKLCIMGSLVGIFGGLWIIYPVFAFYTPDFKCASSLVSFCESNPDTCKNVTASMYDGLFDIKTNKCQSRTMSKTQISACLQGDNIRSCLEDSVSVDLQNCDYFTYFTDKIGTYDDSKFTSMVTEFGLVCDRKFVKPFVTSMTPIAIFFGAGIGGPISDFYGRRKAMGLSMIATTVSGLAAGYMPSWGLFLVFWFVIHFSVGLFFLASHVYTVEVLEKNQRELAILPSLCFSVGFGTLSLSHYFIPNWRSFTLAQSCLCFLYLPIWLNFPESPSWLALQKKPENENEKKSMLSVDEKPKDKISSLVTHPLLRRIFIIMANIFCATSMVYYGLNYNAAGLPGSAHVNNAMNALVEFIGFIAAIYTMKRLNRRAVISGSLIIGGATCAVCSILFHPKLTNENLAEIGRWSSFIGTMMMSACFGILWVFVCELYPTSIRSSGTAGGSMAARVGAVCAPYVIMTDQIWIPYLIFASYAIISGLTALYLEETKDQPIPDTVEEMERIHNHQKTSKA